MKEKVLQEIKSIVSKIPTKEQKIFSDAEEFYEFLKIQGLRANFEDVKAVLTDLSKQAKQELFLEDLDAVAGGSQVEVNNTVKNNGNSVNIGPTIVINM